MRRILNLSKLRRFPAQQQGATAIEYALIAAGVAAAIIVTVNALGVSVVNMWTTDLQRALRPRPAFFSRRDFLCAERIGEPLRRRTRLERLLLALVRRPSGQPDDLEGRAQASVGVGEAVAVDILHPIQASRA